MMMIFERHYVYEGHIGLEFESRKLTADMKDYSGIYFEEFL